MLETIKLCAKKMSSGLFKNVISKIYVHKSYIFNIYVQIVCSIKVSTRVNIPQNPANQIKPKNFKVLELDS